MRDGGRIAAAIEVLGEIETRHRPARLALKAWGEAARYAGAKDRAFVSGLVLDGLRHRRSLAWRMEAEGPRPVALGSLRFLWGWPAERIAQAAAEGEHGPGLLSAQEAARLEGPRPLEGAPAPIQGDYPDWLEPHLARAFGEERVAEANALARRAPVDLRVNTLKADVGKVERALAAFAPHRRDEAPNALRIAAPAAAERAAPVEATPAFEKGWFEVQDLGSQIAALAAGEVSGRQVMDLCAGGGGKTLALAAAMGNSGQLWAFDRDRRRLAETVRRGRRAGVRNLQLPAELDSLADRMDLVFIDAPCSGTGTWRRHPDAKWRLTPAQLEQRQAEQDGLLHLAARLAKPAGRLVYVTCSVLCDENEDRIADFLAAEPGWRPAAPARRLSPLSAGADGFFIQALERGLAKASP